MLRRTSMAGRGVEFDLILQDNVLLCLMTKLFHKGGFPYSGGEQVDFPRVSLCGVTNSPPIPSPRNARSVSAPYPSEPHLSLLSILDCPLKSSLNPSGVFKQKKAENVYHFSLLHHRRRRQFPSPVSVCMHYQTAAVVSEIVLEK